MNVQYVNVVVRIKRNQKEMINSSPLNLSKFVRIKLDEEFVNNDDVVVWKTNENIS